MAIGVAIAAIGFAQSGAMPVVSLPGALPLFFMNGSEIAANIFGIMLTVAVDDVGGGNR